MHIQISIFRLPTLLLALVCLISTAEALPPTHYDFGHGSLVDAEHPVATGIRPCLVVLLDDSKQVPGSGFDANRGAAYFGDLFFNLNAARNNIDDRPNPNVLNLPDPRLAGSLNRFLLENSKGQFILSRATGPAHTTGVMGPLATTDAESDIIYESYGNEDVVGRIALDVATRGGLILKSFDADGDGVVRAAELTLAVITSRPQRRRNTDGTFIMDSANNLTFSRVNGYARFINDTYTAYTPPGQPAGNSASFYAHFLAFQNRTDFATIAHEATHVFGTRDVYAYKTGLVLNQGMTLMGPTLGPEYDTGVLHLDCWHKMALGWAEPKIVSMRSGGRYSIPATDAGDKTNAIILHDPAKGTNEFFMLEYRTNARNAASTYESSLGANGLFLWHVVLNPATRALQVNSPSTLNLLPNPIVNGLWTEGPSIAGNIGVHTAWQSNQTSDNLKWNSGIQTQCRFRVHPFNPGDTEITVEILSEYDTWVNFGYVGPESGSFSEPYNTFQEGINAVGWGGNLRIRPGTTPETATNISKRMTITAEGGVVTIGQP